MAYSKHIWNANPKNRRRKSEIIMQIRQKWWKLRKWEHLQKKRISAHILQRSPKPKSDMGYGICYVILIYIWSSSIHMKCDVFNTNRNFISEHSYIEFESFITICWRFSSRTRKLIKYGKQKQFFVNFKNFTGISQLKVERTVQSKSIKDTIPCCSKCIPERWVTDNSPQTE